MPREIGRRRSICLNEDITWPERFQADSGSMLPVGASLQETTWRLTDSRSVGAALGNAVFDATGVIRTLHRGSEGKRRWSPDNVYLSEFAGGPTR